MCILCSTKQITVCRYCKEKALRSVLVSRNIIIKGRRTSVRLDHMMWDGLIEISQRQGASIHDICTAIATHKASNMSTTTAIRMFILNYFREAATEEGHLKSGHYIIPDVSHLQKLVETTLT